MMIGAPDMALPRLNNLSFWILPFAFSLLISTLFMEGGGPNFGWTFYAPLSTTYAPSTVTFFIFGVHMMGASSIMGSINIIATILNMRAPGMTLMKMPLFVWTWLITAYLLLAVMPVLAGVVTMMLFDVHFHTSFFNAAGGGDPVMFQHMFWFFGHPEVYIMILPAFGVVSQIIPTFARKPLFGYDSMVYAVASIAFLSFIVWAHHMFTVGMPLAGQLFFMYATMLIAVPTGVKVFNWVATMWRGSMTFETPMLFSIAFVILFTIGGFSGLMLAMTPVDFQISGHLLRRRALPLRARAGFVVRHHRGRVLLVAEVVRTYVRRVTRQAALLVVVHRRERDVLPAALLGSCRNAATRARLRAAIRRLQHDLEYRRVHLRVLAGVLPVRRDQDDQKRQAGNRSSMGRCARSRMDGAVAGAVSHIHASSGSDRSRGALVRQCRRVVQRRGSCSLLVVGMFGFGFALVPMYDVLCKVTGLGGRTGGLYVYDPAKVKPDESRLVKVTFLTNTNDGMTWEFRAEQSAVHVHPGELNEAKFFVRNTSDHTMVAQAVPSLAPGSAAEYFHKTECFCFTRQVLAPGQETRNADAVLRVAGSAAGTGIDFSFVHFVRRHSARSRRTDRNRGLSSQVLMEQPRHGDTRSH